MEEKTIEPRRNLDQPTTQHDETVRTTSWLEELPTQDYGDWAKARQKDTTIYC